jgi:hypothetical protein
MRPSGLVGPGTISNPVVAYGQDPCWQRARQARLSLRVKMIKVGHLRIDAGARSAQFPKVFGNHMFAG